MSAVTVVLISIFGTIGYMVCGAATAAVVGAVWTRPAITTAHSTRRVSCLSAPGAVCVALGWPLVAIVSPVWLLNRLAKWLMHRLNPTVSEWNPLD